MIIFKSYFATLVLNHFLPGVLYFPDVYSIFLPYCTQYEGPEGWDKTVPRNRVLEVGILDSLR